MRQLLVHVLVCALVFGFPGVLSARDLSWIGQRSEKKWQPHFEVSFRSGNHDRYGLELDPFIPIAQDDRSLWFLNVRNGLSWVNNDFRHEINVGGGYRRIAGERWILGGYGFFDRVKTSFDNYFNQGTLGVEALSLDWDLRFNGYLADDTTKSAGGGGVRLVGTQLKMDSGVEQALSGFDGELGWRLPFDSNLLLGDTRLYAGGFFFEASDVSSIAGPRTRFEMRIHDIPFLSKGSRITLGTEYTWDGVRGSEVTSLVSLRIPFGGPSRSESLTPLERRMTDRVVRDVAVMTNVGGGTEAVRSEAGVVIGDTFFFDSTGGGDGSFESPLDLPTAIPTGAANALLIGLNTTGDIVGLAETLLDGQTVLGGGTGLRVWGVNSGNIGLFTAPGSAATFRGGLAPTLTLARNNTIAGLTFTGVSEALRLTQVGGSSITSILGNTFNTVGPGINANWSGSFDATLNLRDNTFQAGTIGLLASLAPDGSSGPSSFDLAVFGNSFDSLGTAISVGVAASGVADYSHSSTISGNTFTSNGNDYELIFGGAGATGFIDIDVAVDSNSSTGAGSDFTNVSVRSVASGHVDLEISDNDIVNAGGKAIDIDLYAAPDFDGVISNNRIVTAGNDGIRVDVYASGSLNGHSLSINNNALQYVGNDGIDVYFGGGYYYGYGYDTTLTIADNIIQDVTRDGIEVDFWGNGHAAGNVAIINGNTVQNFGDDGIDVDFEYGYDTTVTIADNTISTGGAYSDGIYFYSYANGHDLGNSLTINRNTIQDVADYGIYVYNYNDRDTATSITDNNIVNAGRDGIYFSSDNGGHDAGDSLTISRNTIQDVGDDGIDVYFGYGYDTTLAINDNSIQYALRGGIEVDFYGNGHAAGDVATINGNTIQNVGDDGIDVYFGYGYDATLTIANNIIRDTSREGIEVEFDSNGHAAGNVATINGNTVQNFGDDGIDVYFGYGYDATVTIADNTISDDGLGFDDGIYFLSYSNGHATGNSLTINRNTIQDVGGYGIYVYNYYNRDSVTSITDNNILNAGSDGVSFYSYYYNGHDVGDSLTISRNTIQNVGDDGIDVNFYWSNLDEAVTISDNTIADAGDDGIYFYSYFYNGYYGDPYGPGHSLTISRNDIDRVGGGGIDVYFWDDYRDTSVTIADNSIQDVYGQDGIAVYLDDVGHLLGNSVTINGNDVTNVTNVFSAGIEVDVYNYYGYAATVTIADNTIDQSAGDGIDVYTDAATTLSSSLGGPTLDNIVTNSGVSDADLSGGFSGSLQVNGVSVP